MIRSKENNRNLSGRLPLHKPDTALWSRIASGIEGSPKTAWTSNLPKHEAAPGIWKAIDKQLPATWYSLRNQYTRSSILFILILFVSVFFIGREKDNQLEPATISPAIQATPTSTDQGMVYEYDLQSNKPEEIGHPQQEKLSITNNKVGESEDKPKPMFSEITAEIKDKENSKQGTIIGYPDEINNDPKNKLQANIRPAAMQRMKKDLIASSLNGDPYHPMKIGNHETYARFIPKICHEIGVHFQPGYVKNISSLNDQWYYTPSVGLSFTMRKNRLLFETGINYSWVEFEDRLEIDYYEYEFLGTVISTERYTIENYIDENGQPQTRKNYIVELIDLYDSTFQKEEQTGHVKMTGMEIPFSFGYRLDGGGQFYTDLKTGLNMMVITKVNLSHIPPNGEITQILEVQDDLPDKNNVKWKYHLALCLGYRIGEKMSVYTQPTVLWYIEGMSKQGTSEYKKPIEARLQIGLKWEF